MAAETWGTSSARANAGQLPGGGTETAGPAAQPVLGSQSSRAGLLADQRAPFPAGIGTPGRGGRCPRGPGTASPEARAKCVARTEVQWPQSTHLQGPSRGHPAETVELRSFLRRLRTPSWRALGARTNTNRKPGGELANHRAPNLGV